MSYLCNNSSSEVKTQGNLGWISSGESSLWGGKYGTL